MNTVPDPLDGMLQKWGRRTEADDVRLAQLRQRMTESIQVFDPRAELLTSKCFPGDVRRRGSRRLATMAVAVAVVLLGWVGMKSNLNFSVQEEAIPLKPNAPLLAELERLFPGRLAWVAEMEDDLQFRLHHDSRQAATPDLHIEIVVRTHRKSASVQSWRFRLDSSTQEWVDVAASSSCEQQGSATVWIQRMPDSRIFIETSLKLIAPIALSTTVSGVQEVGATVRIFSFQTPSETVEVRQTVLPSNTAAPEVRS